MSTVLVTGAAGFLGVHLTRELASDHRVVGADRAGLASLPGVEWVEVAEGTGGLAEVVAETEPDLLIHAAFVNRKPPELPDEDYLSAQMALNLGLFRRCASQGVAVLLVSSSAVYGNAHGVDSIVEETPRRPVSLYGLAKTLQEMTAELEAASGRLRLGIVRLFNLIGPGQGPGMLLPDWVSKVQAIAAGGERTLRVRNRATSRDFVDVRDAARALALVAGRFVPGATLNVASGVSVSLRELSEYLETLCPVPYETVETDPLPSGSDVLAQRGDASRLRAEYGWTPVFDWRESVRAVWDAYRGD